MAKYPGLARFCLSNRPDVRGVRRSFHMRNFRIPAAVSVVLLAGFSIYVADAADRSGDKSAAPSAKAARTPDAEKPRPGTLAGAGLRTYWRLKLRLSFNERIVRMYVMDKNLYCLTSGYRLIALDAKRGLTRWEYRISKKNKTVFRPSHVSRPVTLPIREGGKRELKTFNALLFNTERRLIVLDQADGSEIRNFLLPFQTNSAGISDGENFYVGSMEKTYYAMGLDKGVVVWRKKIGGLISAPLEHYMDHVYVAGESHEIYASKAGETGRKVWRQKLGGAVVTAFHVDSRGCFVPCEDGRIYAFHPLSGVKLWEPFVCRKPPSSPIQVGRTAVFQYAKGDRFYAVNISNGAEMWSTPVGRLVLAVIKNDVYLLDKNRNLRIVDEKRGKVKAVVALNKLTAFAPNTARPAIYAASRAGWVFCIKPISAGQLTAEMLKKH